jgi:hypothetical protein
VLGRLARGETAPELGAVLHPMSCHSSKTKIRASAMPDAVAGVD